MKYVSLSLLTVALAMSGCGQANKPSADSAASPPSTDAPVEDIAIAQDAVAERLAAASEAKAAIAERWASTGEFPESCVSASVDCPPYLSINPDGRIAIDLESTGVAALKGASIEVIAEITPDQSIKYQCSSNAPPSYLPSDCVQSKAATRTPSPGTGAPFVSGVDLNLEPQKYAGKTITLKCDYAGFAPEMGEKKGFCGMDGVMPVGIDLSSMDTATFKSLLVACEKCRGATVTGVYDGEGGISYQVIDVPGLTLRNSAAMAASEKSAVPPAEEKSGFQDPCVVTYRWASAESYSPEALSEFQAECPEHELPVAWQQAAALASNEPRALLRASFDCAKAGTAAEKTICADPQIADLDGQLATVYGAALAASADPSAVKADQRDWVKQRNACQDAACLMSTYQDRITELQE